jgi:hypothetical protein
VHCGTGSPDRDSGTRRCELINRIAICLLIALGTACAANAQSAALRITFNVYNDAAVPENSLLKAEEVALRVLQRAGIEGVWINCKKAENGSGTDAACLGPMSPFHLSLRLMPRLSPDSNDSLGVSFLGSDGKGVYADIFYPSVRILCADFDAAPSAVLGGVMAHELGHLMLGAHTHSPIGIMRPRWQGEEVRQIGMETLLFTPEQARKMHARLLTASADRVTGNPSGVRRGD